MPNRFASRLCAFALLLAFTFVPRLCSAQDASQTETAVKMFFATMQNNYEELKALLEAGADPNSPLRLESLPLTVYHGYGNDPAARRKIVRLLLDKGAKVNAADKKGRTPLMTAAADGDTDSMQLLLDRQADCHASDAYGRTALHDAVYCGVPEAVSLLIARGADVNARTQDGETPLKWAVWRSDRENDARFSIAEFLLARGAQVNASDAKGVTPLMEALGRLAMTKLLLAHGADVHAISKDGQTALLTAADYGFGSVANKEKFQTLLLLLANKADAKATDSTGRNALFAVAEWNPSPEKTEMMALLFKKGLSVRARDKQGTSALMIAAKAGDLDAVKFLLAHHADLKPSAVTGVTPLMRAASCRAGLLTAFLLKRGEKVNAQDKSGLTALQWAMPTDDHQRQDTAEWLAPLLAAGAAVNVTDAKGETPLWHCAASSDSEAARLLLEKGADVNCANKEGVSPLMAACMINSESTVAILLKYKADVLTKDAAQETALLKLLHYQSGHRSCDAEIVTLLLQYGADANAKDKAQTPALIVALEHTWIGHKQIVQALLEHKADPNAKDAQNRTPLIANRNADDEIGKLLRQYGATK